MLEGFVWFDNCKQAINMSLVTDFRIEKTKKGEEHLLFCYSGNALGIRICNQDDVRNFLLNVMKLDSLPSTLEIQQDGIMEKI